MFCRHDWHNHKYDKSLRAEWIVDAHKDNPVPLFIVGSMGFLYAVAGAILFGPACCFIAMVVSMVVTIILLAVNITAKTDPWVVADRSCLKCGKVQFNYTKLEEKKEVKKWQKVRKDNKRHNKVVGANIAFEKKKKLRKLGKSVANTSQTELRS